MADWVWCLGGSVMAIPTCLEIKERGCKLLVTDLDPDSPCRSLADRFELVSVYDAQANLSLAKRLDFRPVAVLTAGTDAGVEVATIATYFNLPGIHPQTAKRVRHKGMMRGLIKSPYPRFRAGVIPEQFRDWDIYPCVTKPVDAAGSKGFSVVKSRDELGPALIKARAANRYGVNAVLVEELLIPQNVIPGLQFDTAEIALDFLVYEGEVTWINGALRLFWKHLKGIEFGHINPFTPDEKILEIAQIVATKLGVTWGPLKLDFMQDARYGWVLQECATRLSGGFDHMYSCPLATGKNIVGAALDLALGLPLDPSKLVNRKGKYASVVAPIYKPGKIDGWVGLDRIPDGCKGFPLATTEIKPLESNANRPIFFMAEGNTPIEAMDNAISVSQKVEPNYL